MFLNDLWGVKVGEVQLFIMVFIKSVITTKENVFNYDDYDYDDDVCDDFYAIHDNLIFYVYDASLFIVNQIS